MDLGTIIGLFLVTILLVGAMVMGVGVQVYIDFPSLLITVGGSISALLISFKLENMKNIFKYLGIAFKPHQYNIPLLIKTIVEYAIKARRDGILSLEQNVNQEENDFLRKGLSMAVDGSEPDSIRELLEIDMEQSLNRHNSNADIFETWASLAGAYGMLGTLIGLVAMLVNMSDPSSIGPAMAVALITTFYGSLIGNTIGTPIANILKVRAQDEALMKLLVIEGIISIQAGDNPRVLETKLLSFLPPNQRFSQFD